MDYTSLRQKLISDNSLQGLSNAEIAQSLNSQRITENPITEAPQILKPTTLNELTAFADGDEWANLNSIKDFGSWASPRIDLDELLFPSSNLTKLLLRAIATAAPEMWDEPLFDLIDFALENLTNLETYPRNAGELIYPEPTEAEPEPLPRSLLNAIGVVLVEQGILSLRTFGLMAARLQEVYDDPSWTPQILIDSWSVDNLGKRVSPGDVQRALEG